jgi:hypothetical protein
VTRPVSYRRAVIDPLREADYLAEREEEALDEARDVEALARWEQRHGPDGDDRDTTGLAAHSEFWRSLIEGAP